MIKLVVGSEQGKIFYFDNIENNLTGYFNESDLLYETLDTVSMQFKEGMRSAAVVSDLNQDGIPEMIAGNYSGGLRLYSNMNYVVSPRIRQMELSEYGINLIPNLLTIRLKY